MSVSPKELVVLSETLPLGGTATFVMNLCCGMAGRQDWNAAAAGLRGLNEIGLQIQSAGLTIFTPGESAVLHEERIEEIYRQCAARNTRAVAAGLGSGAFDFLRYVPEGCLRIGMIQSDDGCVYDLVERYLPWMDIVAGVSLEICRKMEARLTDKRVRVVHQPYGVPMPQTPVVARTEGPMRILYLGRVIEEQKRVKLMSRVMKRTLESGAQILWTIAGDGPDLESMKQEFSTHPDRVTFTGNVPYQQVPALVAGHDVYFLCSDYEGLPLSLLEAMGAGLVPVVSDLPSGISEVVNEQNGIRVPINDEAGYANSLVRLASDPLRRSSMAIAAASEVRESHSTLAMARRWEAMLDANLSDKIPGWPPTCTATAPMELDGQWQFSPAMRPVRKLLKRLNR